MLKSKQVGFIKLGDWDGLVSSTYGRPYSFQQQIDCKERGLHKFRVPEDSYDYPNDDIDDEESMGVSFAGWLAKDPSHKNNLYWGRNFYPNVSMIINDLYAKGLIEKGEYAIEIDW